MDTASIIQLSADIVRVTAFILVYFVTGFGPGFIAGLLLANTLFGKGMPLRMEKHEEAIRKAAEHNSQWHPDNPKWK